MATIRKRTWTTRGATKTAWLVDYRDQAGKRRFKQFERKKDADAFMVRARGEVAAGVHTADAASITVADACALWLQRCEADGLERSTIEQRGQHVRLHIQPLLGAQKLSRLTAPKVQEFADQLIAGGRSRALARKVLTNLGAAVGEAQRRGLVAQNVARGVRLRMPRRQGAEVVPPTKAEIRALLAAAEQPARQNEVFGARPRSVCSSQQAAVCSTRRNWLAVALEHEVRSEARCRLCALIRFSIHPRWNV